MQTIALREIADYLDCELYSQHFPDDQQGIYHHSARPVQRIGLALEPWPTMEHWIVAERLDALFLHRPWRLAAGTLDEKIGILSYHLAFDLSLTFGFNLRLAALLRMSDPYPFAVKDEVPLGMIGEISPVRLEQFVDLLTAIFGKRPILEGVSPDRSVRRLAVVGAMTDSLVREASDENVQLYLTGELRHPARSAVRETGMTVCAVGHAAGEQWGLRALAGLLLERWAHLAVVLAPSSAQHP